MCAVARMAVQARPSVAETLAPKRDTPSWLERLSGRESAKAAAAHNTPQVAFGGVAAASHLGQKETVAVIAVATARRNTASVVLYGAELAVGVVSGVPSLKRRRNRGSILMLQLTTATRAASFLLLGCALSAKRVSSFWCRRR